MVISGIKTKVVNIQQEFAKSRFSTYREGVLRNEISRGLKKE
jgi:hypothetical protein